MRHPIRVSAVLVLSAALLAGPAPAADAPRAHEGGFFARLAAGPGGANTGADDAAPGSLGLDLAAFTLDVDGAIGVVVMPNLAVHGTLFGWSMITPKVKVDGESVYVGPDSSGAALLAYGLGATYYFAPSNVYVSASAGPAQLSLDYLRPDGDVAFSSEWGWAMQGMVGKEWWTSDRWGIGVAFEMGYHSIPDADGSDWSGFSWGVLFSATLN